VVVVDVRAAADYEAGHIPGARSIPLDQVEKRVAALKALKKPIVLYCA
jgi:rhodanese-related sulfurtransferase